MKKCTRCKTDKSESEFQVRAASRDSLTAACSKCLSDYDKSRANAPHRVKQREEYSKTEAGIESAKKAKAKWAAGNKVEILEATRAYRKANKKKTVAHGIVGFAIKTGFLTREPCQVCGADDVHGHHDDYAKPLSVRWLCPKHHKQWHSENGEGLNG